MTAGDSVAGRSSSSAGTSTWAVMIEATLRVDRRPERHELDGPQPVRRVLDDRQRRGANPPVVSPCPGKCLPHAAMPSSCSVRMITAPSRRRPPARSCSARSPMTGLVGLVWTSSTGA